MNGKNKFEYNATIDRARAAEYLTRIAEGLTSGTIGLSAEGQRLDLSPSSVVKIEIEAESNSDKNRGSLVFELTWKATIEKPHGDLEISTVPTEAPAAEAVADVVAQ